MPVASTTSRLDHLDALRGLLVLLVVAIHALGYAGLPAGPARTTIDFIVSTIAVQGFYFVDGLLFARRIDRAGGPGARGYLADSARRLLWPWLLFSVGYAVARAAAERYGVVEPTALSQDGLSPAALLGSIWWSHAAPHLYFLPSLFLIRCAAVVIWPLLRAPAAVLLVVGTVALLAFRTVIEPGYFALVPHEGLDPLLHALGGMGFFVLGAGMWRLAGETGRLSAAWIVGPLILAGVSVFAPRSVHNVAVQLGYLLPLYALFARYSIGGAAMTMVGRQTMGIYLLHMPIVMKIWAMILGRLVDPAGLLDYFLLVATSFATALAISLATHRIGLGALVFGERKAAPRLTPAA